MIGYVIVFAIFGWVVLKYNNQDYFLQNLITVNTKKSTQDIAFIKDIASIVTMAEYVYQIEDAKHKSSNSQQIRLIRKNLDKILYTHEVFYDTNSYELMTHNPSRAQVAIFLDYKKKAIFVIIAGTRLEGSREHLIYDIKDNLYLITGTVPSKVESIMNLNKSIVFKYKDKLQKGWVIHYSGHSLGAYYAEFGALHMCYIKDCIRKLSKENSNLPFKNMFESIKVNKISLTIFESPGGTISLKNVQHALKTKLQDIGNIFALEEYNVFNSVPNPINSLNTKIIDANHFTVIHPHYENYKIWKIWYITTILNTHKHLNFLNAFALNRGSIIGSNDAIHQDKDFDHNLEDVITTILEQEHQIPHTDLIVV